MLQYFIDPIWLKNEQNSCRNYLKVFFCPYSPKILFTLPFSALMNCSEFDLLLQKKCVFNFSKVHTQQHKQRDILLRTDHDPFTSSPRIAATKRRTTILYIFVVDLGE